MCSSDLPKGREVINLETRLEGGDLNPQLSLGCLLLEFSLEEGGEDAPLLDPLPRRAQPPWYSLSSLSSSSLTIALSDLLLIATPSLYRLVLKLNVETAAQIGPDSVQTRGTPAPPNKKRSSE